MAMRDYRATSGARRPFRRRVRAASGLAACPGCAAPSAVQVAGRAHPTIGETRPARQAAARGDADITARQGGRSGGAGQEGPSRPPAARLETAGNSIIRTAHWTCVRYREIRRPHACAPPWPHHARAPPAGVRAQLTHGCAGSPKTRRPRRARGLPRRGWRRHAGMGTVCPSPSPSTIPPRLSRGTTPR